MIEKMDKVISRRTLLKGAVAAALAGVAFATVFTGKAVAAKATKASESYQDKPNGDKQCSNCSLFIPGKTPKDDGACQVVDGSISPHGYCVMYSKKS